MTKSERVVLGAFAVGVGCLALLISSFVAERAFAWLASLSDGELTIFCTACAILTALALGVAGGVRAREFDRSNEL